ncbi:MAG: diguanylate cyclase [Phycisphaerae bacterium]
MRARGAVLAIGPVALRAAVARALPDMEVFGADTALAGLWEQGRQRCERAVVSLAAGRGAVSAVRGIRAVTPRARIVVSCSPAREPDARRLLQNGADAYLLEPVMPEELRVALELPAEPGDTHVPSGPVPSFAEFVELGNVLRGLGDGPQATLARLAALALRVFQARGARLVVGAHEATAGDVRTIAYEQPVERDGRPTGVLALGPAIAGDYPAETEQRLAEFARLVDAYVALAVDQHRWRRLAWTDDLSGLANRRFFEEQLAERLQPAAEHRSSVTVLLFDIDDFKSYNDRFGHSVGDALLRELALLLRRCTREQDVVARYGGDEFAVVFCDPQKPRVAGSTHPTDPLALAERFAGAIAQHHFTCLGAAAPGPVTISGGLATYPWDGSTATELLAAADAALLDAKRSGKHRIHLAGDAVRPDAERSE